MDADGNGAAMSPLASAVARLGPESRLKLLRIADDLVMHLMESELPAPSRPEKIAQHGDSVGMQAVPLTPEEQTAILTPKLGVIRIDYDYTPALGDVDHEKSFSYPVEYETVKGLTFELCQSGHLTQEIIDKVEVAVNELHNNKGCDVIIGNCGFMFQFQQVVVNFQTRPSILLLSALSQLPTLITALGPEKKVAIMTANSKTFEHMLELLEKDEKSSGHTSAYSISRAPRNRYVVVGCQGVPNFGDEVAKGQPIVYEKAEPGILALAWQTLCDHCDVDMFLLECTELPQFANSLRIKTGKPVYTAITLANMAMTGRQSNPRFGRQQWKKVWLEQQKARIEMRLDQLQASEAVCAGVTEDESEIAELTALMTKYATAAAQAVEQVDHGADVGKICNVLHQLEAL